MKLKATYPTYVDIRTNAESKVLGSPVFEVLVWSSDRGDLYKAVCDKLLRAAHATKKLGEPIYVFEIPEVDESEVLS